MYACRKATRISKAVRNSSIPKGRIPIGMKANLFVSASTSASVSRANVTSRMCPAIMLAISRTVCEKGRMNSVEMTSITPTSGFSAVGTPGGQIM